MLPDTFTPGQGIPIETVPNLRDLGGWPTPNGVVSRNKVFRSAQFSNLSGADAEAFAALRIRTVFDLRTEAERDEQANVVPSGTTYTVIDILRDSVGAAPAQLLALQSNPKHAEALLGGGKAISMFENAYRDLIDLPSARAGYHQLFSALADESQLPAEFHCTTGKDRTGWAAAALLLVLGVS